MPFDPLEPDYYCIECRKPISKKESDQYSGYCEHCAREAMDKNRKQANEEIEQRKRALMDGKMAAQGYLRCENCGEYYKAVAGYCKHCNQIKTDISEYRPHGMCPFTVAKVGGGGTIAGIGGEAYTWRHMPCMGIYCVLWDVENECCGFLTSFGRRGLEESDG